MEPFSVIMMVVILGTIWGGFFYFLQKAWKSEQRK